MIFPVFLLIASVASLASVGFLHSKRAKYFAISASWLLLLIATLHLTFSNLLVSSQPSSSLNPTHNITKNDSAPSIVPDDLIISTLQTREFPTLAKILGIKESYCSAHGYTFAPSFTIPSSVDRHPAWSKLIRVRDLMQSKQVAPTKSQFERNYGRWILMSDFDVIIMNQKLKIEDHILEPVKKQRLAKSEKTMDDLMLILTTDCNGLNTGNSLWRNSPDTVELINILWQNNGSDVFAISAWWEQAALLDVIKMSKDARNMTESDFDQKYASRKDEIRSYAKRVDLGSRIEYVEQRIMNAYPSEGCGYKYQEGDFLIHFPGIFKPEFKNYSIEVTKNK